MIVEVVLEAPFRVVRVELAGAGPSLPRRMQRAEDVVPAADYLDPDIIRALAQRVRDIRREGRPGEHELLVAGADNRGGAAKLRQRYAYAAAVGGALDADAVAHRAAVGGEALADP